MENIANQVERIMDDLDRSQDELEEMAFNLLNAVDHVRTHNEEMRSILEFILETEEEVAMEAIQKLQAVEGRVSRAMAVLESLIHKNEEVCSGQRKSVEEAKQAVDFLRCACDSK